MVTLRRLRALRRDQHGSTLVETTIVFPMMLVLTFGLVEFGRVLWEYAAVEKATTVGARFLATCKGASTGEDEEGDDEGGSCRPILDWQGNCLVPEGAAQAVDPQTGATRAAQPGDSCSIVVGAPTFGPVTCPGGSGCSGTDMTLLLARMQAYAPFLKAANVQVQVRGSGMGFIGRGPDSDDYRPIPLITVRTTGLTYNFVALNKLPGLKSLGSITMPGFDATSVGEDQREGSPSDEES